MKVKVLATNEIFYVWSDDRNSDRGNLGFACLDREDYIESQRFGDEMCMWMCGLKFFKENEVEIIE